MRETNCAHDWDTRKRLCRRCGVSVYAYLVTLDPRIADTPSAQLRRLIAQIQGKAAMTDLGIGPDNNTHSDPYWGD